MPAHWEHSEHDHDQQPFLPTGASEEGAMLKGVIRESLAGNHIGSPHLYYSEHEIFTRNLLSSVSAVQSASAALHISQMCSFGAVICSDM